MVFILGTWYLNLRALRLCTGKVYSKHIYSSLDTWYISFEVCRVVNRFGFRDLGNRKRLGGSFLSSARGEAQNYSRTN